MIEKSNAGRKKEYPNQAARQKAYRERKKTAKNSAEIRLLMPKAVKTRMERIATHQECSSAELLERLLNQEEDRIMNALLRNNQSLKDYLGLDDKNARCN